jgi:hypothetical protein
VERLLQSEPDNGEARELARSLQLARRRRRIERLAAWAAALRQQG